MQEQWNPGRIRERNELTTFWKQSTRWSNSNGFSRLRKLKSKPAGEEVEAICIKTLRKAPGLRVPGDSEEDMKIGSRPKIGGWVFTEAVQPQDSLNPSAVKGEPFFQPSWNRHQGMESFAHLRIRIKHWPKKVCRLNRKSLHHATLFSLNAGAQVSIANMRYIREAASLTNIFYWSVHWSVGVGSGGVGSVHSTRNGPSMHADLLGTCGVPLLFYY